MPWTTAALRMLWCRRRNNIHQERPSLNRRHRKKGNVDVRIKTTRFVLVYVANTLSSFRRLQPSRRLRIMQVH
jgi:hypothetical protein